MSITKMLVAKGGKIVAKKCAKKLRSTAKRNKRRKRKELDYRINKNKIQVKIIA